ncbi:MAG: hypothetical protein JO107_14640 [Hyphomicrobiales bacterium]|nr:hypothetical protein [Hyphomicrobiales bacterium]
MLVNLTAPAGSGEERYSQAWAVLLLTFLLWITLALLLVVGGVKGRMPGWAALAAVFLHPVAGFAEFVALDAVSRGVPGAAPLVALLPLLIAAYALWARLPQLHASWSPRAVSLAVWGAVALLALACIATGL